MAKKVIMLKSCAVMAWGKSHSAPKGAALIFPDDVANSLVLQGLARFDDYTPPQQSNVEHATAKPLNKQTRKGGKQA